MNSYEKDIPYLVLTKIQSIENESQTIQDAETITPWKYIKTVYTHKTLDKLSSCVWNDGKNTKESIPKVVIMLQIDLYCGYVAVRSCVEEAKSLLEVALKLALFVAWLGVCGAEDSIREDEEYRLGCSIRSLSGVSLCSEKILSSTIIEEIGILQRLARKKIDRLA